MRWPDKALFCEALDTGDANNNAGARTAPIDFRSGSKIRCCCSDSA
jgi:hypothetical protein